MGTLLKWLLIICTLGCALMLTGGVLSQYFDPADYWYLAFLGLVFPILVLLNCLFLLFWLVKWKKAVFISIVALLISFPAMQSSFSLFSGNKPDSETHKISITSYNVRLFDVFNWSGRKDNGLALLDFLGESDTDIICMQEFMVNNSQAYNLKNIKAKLPDNPYSRIEYNFQSYKRKHGLAIFSKYPIINSGKGIFPGTRNMFMYADIVLVLDTIRVINNHLESIHLDYSQYNLIDSLNLSSTQSNREEYRRILGSIRQAFRKRAEQARILKEEINKSPFPVIVCGDFNDTPVSYTYHTIKKGMNDSFVSNGKWLGASYKQFMFPLRIDYILHDRVMSSGNHEVLNIDFSDHKPVRTDIWFKE